MTDLTNHGEVVAAMRRQYNGMTGGPSRDLLFAAMGMLKSTEAERVDNLLTMAEWSNDHINELTLLKSKLYEQSVLIEQVRRWRHNWFNEPVEGVYRAKHLKRLDEILDGTTPVSETTPAYRSERKAPND